MFQDIIVSGLINGSVYALLAIGFSLIFGVARIVNIAHTAFYMVSAYGIYFGLKTLGMIPPVAIMLSIAFVTGIALVCYRLFIDPIREHEAAVLIATIALAMVFQELMLIKFGGQNRGIAPLFPGYTWLLGVKVTYQQLLTLGVAVVVLAVVWGLLMRTKLGLAIRATAQDREVANLMGMDVAHVATLTMIISAALAAVAGAIVVPLTILEPHMWMHPLIMMLAVVVLGGLGSIKGSFLGAYILGFAEALVIFLIPAGAFLRSSVALSIMIIMLLIRPEGLFGVAFEEER
jgi:branched-chain amino acid transport system permease protein